MGHDSRGSGSNTGIVILIAIVVLAIPCVLGLLLVVGGGLMYSIRSAPPVTVVAPTAPSAPPLMVPMDRDAPAVPAEATPSDALPEPVVEPAPDADAAAEKSP